MSPLGSSFGQTFLSVSVHGRNGWHNFHYTSLVRSKRTECKMGLMCSKNTLSSKQGKLTDGVHADEDESINLPEGRELDKYKYVKSILRVLAMRDEGLFKCVFLLRGK